MQSEGMRACTMQPASELGAGDAFTADLIPRWVADAVLRNRYPLYPDLKCAFFLKPSEVWLMVGVGYILRDMPATLHHVNWLATLHHVIWLDTVLQPAKVKRALTSAMCMLHHAWPDGCRIFMGSFADPNGITGVSLLMLQYGHQPGLVLAQCGDASISRI